MSLIEKIDAEIAENSTDRIRINDAHERDIWNNGNCNGVVRGLELAKKLILSEQKEPCGWCAGDYRMEFNWIDKNGNTVVTDNHEVIGGIADYCPVCGRYLNQPSTGTE